ncbi:F390 synthetase-related protein [Pseudomonas sediminis]|uniref:F390 synthetase-related protein n=1 Tax=Pseudomonas sediminis TaxID=1691904 RepID=UPI0031CC7168
MHGLERLRSVLRVAGSFIHSRWRLRFSDRRRLEAWQARQLQQFLRETAPQAPRLRAFRGQPLEYWPEMDKALLMNEFSACNSRGIELQAALDVALQAEHSRDFSPLLGELTVGLSSGTSGHRGVFLVGREERERWAGTLLARTLPTRLLGHLLPWREPLRIAFFLRANSRLYTTLSSRRIDFAFHDLLLGLDAALGELERQQPHVLVAPATVLRALADAHLAGRLHIAPEHLVSVAEVLEEEDAQRIEHAFGRRPAQIYQASEGFLGYSCERGNLHLNETHLLIEPEWLDQEQRRFQPLITDFSRTTQIIVRYRLNDILQLAPTPCPCGRAERTLAAIEGRADEVFWLPALDGSGLRPLYPDLLRRAVATAAAQLEQWRICQDGMDWHLQLQAEERVAAEAALREALATFFQQQQVQPATLHISDWLPDAPGAKRRRLLLQRKPEGAPCTY